MLGIGEKLIFDITKILPTIRSEKYSNRLYVEITSKDLCEKLNSLGIPYGNKIKNNATIPDKILKSESFKIACLRGLIDTDGSICRRGNYMCLAFDSHNKNLLNQVWKIGVELKIFTYRNKTQVGTNSWTNIIRYFSLIGSSNLRHIIKFIERHRNHKRLFKEDVLSYFNKYKDVELPYTYGLVV